MSIRFNEPGWQWSGCFLPDYLGDTQLKMRNYISGAICMIRVEVQNADVSIQDEKVFGSHHGNSGTNLVLLSDDDTGFMPYRIDNFSKEVGISSINDIMTRVYWGITLLNYHPLVLLFLFYFNLSILFDIVVLIISLGVS